MGGGAEIGVEKKPVIGGVWCLSNTERLVMIPLAPHTERERQRKGGRERHIGGERDNGSQREGRRVPWRWRERRLKRPKQFEELSRRTRKTSRKEQEKHGEDDAKQTAIQGVR